MFFFQLQKAQQASGSDSQELSGKLIQAQTKNQELEMKVAGMEKRTVESVRHVKAAAQNAINEKDKVIQETTAKLKKAEESLQMMDSGSMNADMQNATIRDLEEKCRRLQANQQVGVIRKYLQYESTSKFIITSIFINLFCSNMKEKF